nr:unnamed protein product [Callosobruchus analis]
MGARQSKRSVDITTTPKKDGEVSVEGEGKLEKIGDADLKATTNGSLPHTDVERIIVKNHSFIAGDNGFQHYFCTAERCLVTHLALTFCMPK